eukprot:7078741-Prymnesium_polylepis.1
MHLPQWDSPQSRLTRAFAVRGSAALPLAIALAGERRARGPRGAEPPGPPTATRGCTRPATTPLATRINC